MKELDFNREIKYQFKNKALLTNALTHSSYINESKEGYNANNERLEFLGDAILDAIVSDYLYNTMSDTEEGQMTKIRAAVVCERSLIQCGSRLNIGSYLRLGKGEENSGGRHRNSIIADAVEAVIGAVYLDGGWEAAREFVLMLLEETIKKAVLGKLFSDYKTELQEKLQAGGEVTIHYEVEREEGPDHGKTFYINLSADGVHIGKGSGKSKKDAEQNAAKNALEKMGW